MSGVGHCVCPQPGANNACVAPLGRPWQFPAAAVGAPVSIKTLVTFRFPTRSEVRYPDATPTRGDRVRASGSRTMFVVSSVEAGSDGTVVTAVATTDYLRDVRRSARSSRELAVDLRERAAELNRQTREVQARTRSE